MTVVLDLRWASFPTVTEIILQKTEGHSNISFSVQGTTLFEVEYCTEQQEHCGKFEVELLRPGIKWNHYSIRLDEDLTIKDFNQNYPLVIERKRFTKTDFVYFRYGIAINNLNVSLPKISLKKVVALDGVMKWHSCTY